MSNQKFRKITVESVSSSRYTAEFSQKNIARPNSWDKRVAGIDTITTSEGETIKLHSTGQQSIPQKGWVILLTGGSGSTGYTWTLFGLPKGTFSYKDSDTLPC